MTDDLAPSELTTSVAVADARAVLTVAGEIDLLTVAEFESALAEALAEALDMVVDLREVAFMDSSGLRALLEARRRQEDAGRTMSLAVADGGAVLRLLDLAGVAEMFDPAELGTSGA